MKFQHSSLAAGRWLTFSLTEQLAHIGSEVERALTWQTKNNDDFSQQAFERALELLDLTLDTSLTRSQLRELTRLREVLLDYFWADNTYASTAKRWHTYFAAFAFFSRLQQGA